MSTGTTHCSVCGGLIAEPNKAYGYAGKWCHCASGVWGQGTWPPKSPMREAIERELVLKRVEQDKPTQLKVNLVTSEPGLTPRDFVVWLRGYFAAGGPQTHTQGDAKAIAAELAKVRT